MGELFVIVREALGAEYGRQVGRGLDDLGLDLDGVAHAIVHVLTTQQDRVD